MPISKGVADGLAFPSPGGTTSLRMSAPIRPLPPDADPGREPHSPDPAPAEPGAGGRLLRGLRGLTPAGARGDAWLPESLRHTSDQLAVYVFHGEATIGSDLVVTRRGPGRDLLLGGPAPDGTLIGWATSVHPEDRARHRTAESYAQLKKGRPLTVEFRLVGIDGVVRFIEERLAPRWEHGRLLVDGIAVEVTAHRAARREAEEAHRRLETVMRLARTYVWVADVDRDGGMREVYTRPGLGPRLGARRPAADVSPTPWHDGVHPDDRERVVAAVADARRG